MLGWGKSEEVHQEFGSSWSSQELQWPSSRSCRLARRKVGWRLQQEKKHMYFAIQWFLPDLSPGQPWQIAQCPLHHQTCDDSPPSSTHTLHAFRLPHCMICAELCTPHGRDGLSLHTNQVVIATPCRPWASISSQVIHWFLASLSGLPGTISEKYFTWVSSSSFYPSYYFLSKLFPVEFL